jgi:hypothetical protein
MYTVGFDVRAALSDAPVSSLAFPSVDLRKVAMHPDEEHVEVCQQAREIFAPGLELDDMLHDQMITCTGQGGQASVKTLEEAWPHLVPPREGTFVVAPLGKHSACDELVGGNMQERLVEYALQCLGQG